MPPTAANPTVSVSVLASLRLPPFSLDDAGIAWVQQQLLRLSPEQKLRQLFNLAMHGDNVADARRMAASQPGGVTRFAAHDPDLAWAATRALLEDCELPPLISGDIEGGAIGIPCGTALPNQLGLAAADSLGLSEAAVGVLAQEARALGYNWTFTPVADLNVAFRSAIVATRSYGSDLGAVLAQARVNVQTFQQHGVAATAKHFPGEGFDDRDQHLVTTLNPLDPAAWMDSFGAIYRGLFDAGVMTVMAGHIALPAYARAQGARGLEACRPASVSAPLLQTLLRGELGFNGLIVSDATAMGGLTSWASRAEFVPEVIQNGCDMFLFPHTFESDFAHALAGLRDGRLSEARVEDAVTRVLGLKAALHLHTLSLDERLPPLPQTRATLRSTEHLAIAREAASASVTLVKDTRQTLPVTLRKHRRVVIVSDPTRGGFAHQAPLPLLLPGLLAERGFEVRDFDPTDPPTAENCDLLLYLLAQESLLLQSHIYMDWQRLHGDFRQSMARFWHTVPCVLVSMGHPYYLYDAPRLPCVINAYSAIEPVQQAVLRKLTGEEAFTAISPVDASCGLPDAMD
jgi:beta-N-acetylhexosaminidase